jgi:hypothetical protein
MAKTRLWAQGSLRAAGLSALSSYSTGRIVSDEGHPRYQIKAEIMNFHLRQGEAASHEAVTRFWPLKLTRGFGPNLPKCSHTNHACLVA